jgi:DNA-binding NarL/FixJ family response regulator
LITTLCNLSALSSEIDLKGYSNKHSLEFQTIPVNTELFKKLSERQLKIFTMLTEKKTNNEIAHQLGYSASTIKQETMNIYEILGIRGREDTYLLKSQLEEHLN